MATLLKLCDPDWWIEHNLPLMEFPWPAEAENEKSAALLILADQPKLRAHIGRWLTLAGERANEIGGPNCKIQDALTEQDVLALWNESRLTALS
ncbi:MAG: hypothetical protein PSV22_23915 [Pseudolabrys sp.]|nr:hypothetical protein [Pseudolabrys sp.]